MLSYEYTGLDGLIPLGPGPFPYAGLEGEYEGDCDYKLAEC